MSITITAVNDPPTFTSGADVTDDEDAGGRTIAGWASSISEGAANEGSQTVTFDVSNDDNGLFTGGGQPAIASNGTLTYTLAANANGSTTVSVQAKDDGGTANGGDDDSAIKTFTITVDGINDAPSFTGGADEDVDEDAGTQTVTDWATNISTGPANESGQTIMFDVTSNDNDALFASGPTVDSDGTLTYTPGGRRPRHRDHRHPRPRQRRDGQRRRRQQPQPVVHRDRRQRQRRAIVLRDDRPGGGDPTSAEDAAAPDRLRLGDEHLGGRGQREQPGR